MKKTLLTAIALGALGGAIELVRADDMGSMQGMNMGGSPQTNNAAEGSAMKYYSATGVVESIAMTRTNATIHNQTIPGYMDEMTMDFPVKNTNEFNGVSPGDQITFKVAVGTNDEWIESIQRTGQTAPVMTNSTPPMDMQQSGK
jgi:Cu/Ag efflux protein CusF